MDTTATLAQLESLFGARDSTVVIVQAQVDPDSIGSAMGLEHLFFRRGWEPKVRHFYGGSVGHPQNRAVMNRFNLGDRMRPIDGSGELLESHRLVLVDSNAIKDGRVPESWHRQPALIIDHHQGHQDADGTLALVDTSAGSCCTLIGELLLESSEVYHLDPKVCTMLALGIYTDTKSLIGAGPRDRVVFAAMAAGNEQALAELNNYPLPQSYYDNLAAALDSKQEKRGRAVAFIGAVAPSEADDIAAIADLLLRNGETSLVVVGAMIDKNLRISARCDDLTVNLGEFLLKAFGPSSGAKLTPDYRAEGGALVTIDPGWLASTGATEELMKLIERRLFESVLG